MVPSGPSLRFASTPIPSSPSVYHGLLGLRVYVVFIISRKVWFASRTKLLSGLDGCTLGPQSVTFFDNVTSTRGARDGGSKLATLRSLRDLRSASLRPPIPSSPSVYHELLGLRVHVGPYGALHTRLGPSGRGSWPLRGCRIASARWNRLSVRPWLTESR